MEVRDIARTDHQTQKTILIVDDEEVIREVLANYVGSIGHTTIQADNGRKALHSIQEQNPDLILLDIAMPEMDGIEVLSHLKRSEEAKNIPVIIISAIEEEESRALCIEMGADDYLVKPLNQTMLKARIASSLQKREEYDHQDALRYQELEKKYKKLQKEDLANKKLIQMLLNDLKSPLAISSFNTQFALTKIKEGVIKEPLICKYFDNALSNIQNANNDILRIINGIVDVSKFETETLQLSQTNFDLISCLKEACDTFHSYAHKLEISLNLTYPSEEIAVTADRESFLRVFQNFLANAFQRTGECGKVNVSLERNEKNEVLFFISDNGPKVPEENSDKIFDKFYRIQCSRTRRNRLGLALTFCKMTIETHGGKLWIESSNSDNTTFCFQLPEK